MTQSDGSRSSSSSPGSPDDFDRIVNPSSTPDVDSIKRTPKPDWSMFPAVIGLSGPSFIVIGTLAARSFESFLAVVSPGQLWVGVSLASAVCGLIVGSRSHFVGTATPIANTAARIIAILAIVLCLVELGCYVLLAHAATTVPTFSH
jgi:hypothetical protein